MSTAIWVVILYYSSRYRLRKRFIVFDVLIVGGGIVGSVFALDLAKKRPDLTIALLEKYALSLDQKASSSSINAVTPLFASRIYAITPNNTFYLENIVVVLIDRQNKFYF